MTAAQRKLMTHAMRYGADRDGGDTRPLNACIRRGWLTPNPDAMKERAPDYVVTSAGRAALKAKA